MIEDKSKEANLARVRALANDPTPENLHDLISLIGNLWSGEGYEKDFNSGYIVIKMGASSGDPNYKIMEILVDSNLKNKCLWTHKSYPGLKTGVPSEWLLLEFPKEVFE